jgi:tRNA-2-methylthio-N6-dimethylallyladenosine synthase
LSDSLIPDLSPRPRPVPDSPARTVYIETYGCQMNTYDTQVILGRLADAGFATVDDPMTADLVLLNTCSVREHAEHKVISRVGELRHQREQEGRPPMVLGVCGCMAERMRDQLVRQRNRVDLVVGVDHYDDLPRLAAEVMGSEPAQRSAVAVGHDDSVHYVAPISLYPTNNSHLVTIHKGCDYRCTYCIVPATRGPQVEKDPGLIMDEVAGIVAAGGREVTLLGQNVTAYRWDDALDFAALLQRVARIDGLERIRFLTGHPRDMHPHLIDVIADEDKVCPWLHVPAQSGSDRVLRRMKRRYTRADYLAMVGLARERIADVTFSGDIIVGFPGESEEDFQQTLSLIREVRNDTLFAFKYSERPGVPAARLEDDVPDDVKKRRLADLMAAQDEVWAELAAAEVGRLVSAVVEQPARRPAGHWRLRTANNRKIVVPLEGGAPGEVRRVLITGWQHTSFTGTPSSVKSTCPEDC